MGRLSRFVLPALIALAVYYVLFGGEYSLFEVRRARSEVAVVQTRLDSLTQVNDSLRARADSLQNDLATLERLAREQYGMIRDGEMLYRFTEPPIPPAPDSAGG